MDKEKKNLIQKKIDERELLNKTIKENELNKLKLLENKKKEREDAIKCTEEFNKILEKQENDRIEYFKNIERKSNTFMSKIFGTVLKDMDDKNKQEDLKMKIFLEDKEKQLQKQEENHKSEILNNKKMIKNFLDMQVFDKRRSAEFEKNLNFEQARIWKTDSLRFSEQEKEINQKVFIF